MKSTWQRVIACCLVTLVLVSAVCVGCGEEGGKGKRVVTIGHITDLTGPASSALIPLAYGLEDIVRYYNENDLIPGVYVKVVTYDTRYDPSRDVPAYDWVRGRGAEIIMTPLANTAETLKSFVEKDRIPLIAMATTKVLTEDPGWVFCRDPNMSYFIQTLLKWISEEHWDYNNGIPKIGSAGWVEQAYIEIETGMKEYCQAHPDKFKWVGGYRTPNGSMSWGGEVEKLKDCDYVYLPSAIGGVTFVNQFRDRGYGATFISTAPLFAFIGLTLDGCGWEKMDGTLTAAGGGFLEPMAPFHELARELLYKYHPDQAKEIERAGIGYTGGYDPGRVNLDILRAAIEAVGVDNFDGQAFYDTAVNFSITYEGLPELSYAKHQDPRWANDYVQIWEWKAQESKIVLLHDWMLCEGVGG